MNQLDRMHLKTWRLVAWQWLRTHWDVITDVIGVLVLAICGLYRKYDGFSEFFTNPLTGFVLAGTILSLASKYELRGEKIRKQDLLALREQTLSLESQIAEICNDHYDMVCRYLSSLSPHLGLKPSDRISLYKYSDGKFLLIGRSSPNPEFDKRTQTAYSPMQGCIREAWKDGECTILNLPNPQTDLEKYSQELYEKYGIPIEISQKFRMKSRSYYGLAIHDNTRMGKLRRAVVIVESCKAYRSICGCRLMQDRLKKEELTIACFVQSHRTQEPCSV